MEEVGLPALGPRLPELGPPRPHKGRSRRELMVREAEFQRRRDAAPGAGRPLDALPRASGSRRPDAEERPPATGLDGFEPPVAAPQQLPALPALAGAPLRSTKRRRPTLRRPLPAGSPPPRAVARTLPGGAGAFDLAALPPLDPRDAPRAERKVRDKPVTDLADPRIEQALRLLKGRPDAEDGVEPRRPDAEERPPAMGLDGFAPDARVGPATPPRDRTLGELLKTRHVATRGTTLGDTTLTTPVRPAAPPRGTRSTRRKHANSLRRERPTKLTGRLAAEIFSPTKAVRPSADLRLVWQDVFDYEGAPHPARWQFQCEANDWVHDAQHGERQWYTDSLKNCNVRHGKLRIIARRERKQSCKYTSARLRTMHRGDWLYGRVEVRARLPPSKRGLWPAIWLLPTDEVYGGWPHSGEIDVMEHVGWEKSGLIHSACHATRHNPTVGRQRSKAKCVPTAHRKFHVYAMDWTPTRIEIFVDNELILRVDDKGFGPPAWPYDQRFHLLLNLAVGGWGGMRGVDDRAFPACFEIDSVRVFQRPGR